MPPAVEFSLRASCFNRPQQSSTSQRLAVLNRLRRPFGGPCPVYFSDWLFLRGTIKTTPFLLRHDTRYQQSPEAPWPSRGGRALVEPAQMLAALPTESHAPGIPRKPTVLFCWLSKENGALTGHEGLKIAFHACRIDETVPAGAPKREEAVGMGDQAAAGAALKCLGSVSACSIARMMVHTRIPRLKVQGAHSDIQNSVDRIGHPPARWT
jgi:hypothetical protein